MDAFYCVLTRPFLCAPVRREKERTCSGISSSYRFSDGTSWIWVISLLWPYLTTVTFFGYTGGWTQGHAFAMRELYHLSYSTNSFCHQVIFEIGSCFITKTSLGPLLDPTTCASPHSWEWQAYATMVSYWLRWASHKLFAQAGLKPQSFWSLPPKWLGLQVWATVPRLLIISLEPHWGLGFNVWILERHKHWVYNSGDGPNGKLPRCHMSLPPIVCFTASC
jgi:hypothetical protein